MRPRGSPIPTESPCVAGVYGSADGAGVYADALCALLCTCGGGYYCHPAATTASAGPASLSTQQCVAWWYGTP